MHRASPGYAQTIMQLGQQADGSMALDHSNLVMPAHQAMCLAFVLQAMAQKRMQHQQLPPGSHSDAIVQLGLQRPLSVHDLGRRRVSLELSVAVIGGLCSALTSAAAMMRPALLHLHTARRLVAVTWTALCACCSCEAGSYADCAGAMFAGAGACALPMALRHHLPKATVDAVEVDSETLDMAACFFGAQPDAHLSLLCENGLSFLTHPGSRRMVRVAPEHLLTYKSNHHLEYFMAIMWSSCFGHVHVPPACL